jgi:4-hydroxy-3-polyprenylbenzoate decarboxylase
MKLTMPELVDWDLPKEGGFHNCVLVSIHKGYPLHARKVMQGLWGMGQMQFCKCIVVVDADVDVHDYAQVAWRVFNNVDWKRDVLVVDGPLDVLDHSAPQPLWGGKIGIDATSKGPDEGHPREWPPDVRMTPEVKARVDALWSSLGVGRVGSPGTGGGGGASGGEAPAGRTGAGKGGAPA